MYFKYCFIFNYVVFNIVSCLTFYLYVKGHFISFVHILKKNRFITIVAYLLLRSYFYIVLCLYFVLLYPFYFYYFRVGSKPIKARGKAYFAGQQPAYSSSPETNLVGPSANQASHGLPSLTAPTAQAQ